MRGREGRRDEGEEKGGEGEGVRRRIWNNNFLHPVSVRRVDKQNSELLIPLGDL